MVSKPQCAFPAAASADHGFVKANISVDGQGAATAVDIVCEEPLNAGFAQAAVGCLRVQRFESLPTGAPHVILYNLRFDR